MENERKKKNFNRVGGHGKREKLRLRSIYTRRRASFPSLFFIFLPPLYQRAENQKYTYIYTYMYLCLCHKRTPLYYIYIYTL